MKLPIELQLDIMNKTFLIYMYIYKALEKEIFVYQQTSNG